MVRLLQEMSFIVLHSIHSFYTHGSMVKTKDRATNNTPDPTERNNKGLANAEREV